MKCFPIVGGCAVALSFLLGCGSQEGESGDGASAAMPKVALQTDWYAQAETGGFFHGESQGYYTDEEIEVDVRPANPQMINLQIVATGDVEFGVTRIEDFLMAVERGMPLVAVSVYLQRSPLGLMLHASDPAESFADLDGRQVMIQMGKPFHLWLEKQYGINLRAVPHDYGIQRFVTDKSERFIQQAYLTNETYAVRKAGAEVKFFTFSEGGYETFSVLYTRRDYAEANPDVTRKVVRATARAYRDYLTQPADATLALIGELNPVLKPDHLAYSYAQMIDFRMVQGDYGWDGPFYQIDRERARTQFELLADLGMISADFDWQAYLTDAYLPATLDQP